MKINNSQYGLFIKFNVLIRFESYPGFTLLLCN